MSITLGITLGTRAEYDWVHKVMLRDARGSASEYRCAGCGDWARDWAYQHSAEDAELYGGENRTEPYSLNPDDYAPMCRSCHQTLDQRRRWLEPEYRARQLERRSASEFRAKVSARNVKQWQDPGYRERMLAAGAAAASGGAKAVNGKRRRCSGCPMVSNPGNIGHHQKASGHSGYRDLPSKTELAELLEKYL